MADLRQPTFAEREGIKALPKQLELKTVSTETRARVWDYIYHSIKNGKYTYKSSYQTVSIPWSFILRDFWVNVDFRFSDRYDPSINKVCEYAKEKIQLTYDCFYELLNL